MRIKTWNSSYLVNSVWGRRLPDVYLKEFVSLCKLRKVRRVIDVGCGSGLYTAYFSLRGFKVVAIDISRVGLVLTRHLVRSMDWLRSSSGTTAETRSADFINVELPHFPVADDKADAVLVNYTLHQLTHTELASCIAELRRIIRSGGVLLLHEPCGDGLLSPNETVDVLEDGSLFLKKFNLINWNLTRDQLSKMLADSFSVLTEERLEEDGKSKIVFVLEKS